MKKLTIIISLVIVVAAVSIIPILNAISENHYQEGVTLLAKGDYTGALAEFEAAGDHPEAQLKKVELVTVIIPYHDAEQLLLKKDFENAITAFSAISYKDSSLKALEAKYGLADVHFQNGEFEIAIDMFRELENENFSDSSVRVLEATYKLADLKFKNREYETAIDIFKGLENYEDSAEKVLEVTYEMADNYFKNAEYDAALQLFRGLSGKNYKDSAKRQTESQNNVKYIEAAKAVQSGNFGEAYNIYKSLGNFSDSSKKLAETDDAYWQLTVSKGTVKAYNDYISGFPGNKYQTKASAEAERLHKAEQQALATKAYNAAANAKTIPKLDDFISAWKDSPYIADLDLMERATSWINALRADSTLSAPILNNPKAATSKMIDDFLYNYSGHKDEQKVQALLEGDYLNLINSGMISTGISGAGIDYTRVSITNYSNHYINVTIPLGTYFAAFGGNVQNMVVRSPERKFLYPNDTAIINVATACMNIHRDIPHGEDGFSVERLGGSKLERVMKLLNERNASYAVTQAAVWLVTDNPGDYALTNTLRRGFSNVISYDDLEEAKIIVRDAG